ncbi:hypothetical protein [Moheibacter stercoris]|uniref:Haem-binding uptake Tiki superfamily ChaN domain-containing protein n=1 Tax=Moheibacter stercoris TaxID=1628251 RepID=A0ABV2LV93_9FLAO
MKSFLLVLCFFLTNFELYSQEKPTEVLVLSTLHKGHLSNPNYPYETISQIIQNFDPDVLGVEIRAEDLKLDKDYLSKFYPLEMYQYLFQTDSISYYGFDWLGEEIEGIPMPENFFPEISSIIKLRKQLAENQEVQAKLSILSHVSNEKNNLAKISSPQEMIDGRYDVLNRVYYKQMMDLMADTELKGIPEFYLKRDQKIAENILRIIQANSGKKFLFLMGADHRSFTVDYLEEQLGDQIELVQEF